MLLPLVIDDNDVVAGVAPTGADVAAAATSNIVVVVACKALNLYYLIH